MPAPQIPAVLATLGERRPVFHSEADFQHALAWQMQLADPVAQIFLEKQVAVDGRRVHLDLLVRGLARPNYGQPIVNISTDHYRALDRLASTASISET